MTQSLHEHSVSFYSNLFCISKVCSKPHTFLTKVVSRRVGFFCGTVAAAFSHYVFSVIHCEMEEGHVHLSNYRPSKYRN